MLRKTNGATIRVLRETLGISQASLAARAGLSKSYLCEVELGTYQPTLARTRRIASALGVSLDAVTYPVEEAAS
jgi:transcriptional regulator with XRE-family HTH domain